MLLSMTKWRAMIQFLLLFGSGYLIWKTFKPKQSQVKYIHALRFSWLNHLYDPMVYWLTRDKTLKKQLIDLVKSHQPTHILDIGCGTGTLLKKLNQEFPQANITGIDGDPAILKLAKEKLNTSNIELIQGHVEQLPFEDDSFDLIVSSLVFHHLTTEQKLQTLQEIYRTLKPDGRFYLADWGEANNTFTRLLFLPVQILDGFATTQDNVKGQLIPLMKETGFEQVEELERLYTLLGVVSFYRGNKKLKNKFK